MLKTRFITAIFLLSAFFPALFYLPPLGWVALTSLVASLAAWEWGALMCLQAKPRLALAAGMSFICAVITYLQPDALGVTTDDVSAAWRLGSWFYIPAVMFWILFVPVWMSRRWSLPKSLAGLLVGVVLILPTWLALIQLRQIGALALLSIMAVVWLADIAAYFSGRAFGKHKLAPSISPGKTWEGAIGGGLAVILYGFMLSSNLPSVLSNNYGLLFLVLVVLTAVSIIGDLFESLLKRHAGVKDSSNILPGHGGILDRIDSLTSTLPLVALVLLGWNGR